MSRQTIGQRLRARREFLEMSQETLAGQLGVQQSTLSQYESGKRGLKAADLERLARLLKVPVSYFFGDLAPELSEDEGEVLYYYRGVPPLLRSSAKAALKALYDSLPDAEEGPTYGRKKE